MKILFISERILTKGTGAEQVAKRNLDCIIDIFGEDNTHIVSFKNDENRNIKLNYKNLFLFERVSSSKDKFINYSLRANLGGIDNTNQKEILSLIEKNNYDYIFFDSSLYGTFMKKVKEAFPQKKQIVFFHDVTKYWIKSIIKSTTNIKEKAMYMSLYYSYIKNEKLSCETGDIFITLNKRDSKLIEKEYNIKVNEEIPVSLKDIFEVEKIDKNIDKKSINILFIGVYYLPNVEGIKWFIDNVLDHIDAKLTIVGKGMEKLKEEITNENIEIHGFVEDIGMYYYQSNFVIAPIFDGGGMKVKVAEALMYGKTIFGTKEAFEGYDLPFEQIGYKCESAQEFIKNINDYIENNKIDKFNEVSRAQFNEKYDYSVSLNKMKKIFNYK